MRGSVFLFIILSQIIIADSAFAKRNTITPSGSRGNFVAAPVKGIKKSSLKASGKKMSPAELVAGPNGATGNTGAFTGGATFGGTAPAVGAMGGAPLGSNGLPAGPVGSPTVAQTIQNGYANQYYQQQAMLNQQYAQMAAGQMPSTQSNNMNNFNLGSLGSLMNGIGGGSSSGRNNFSDSYTPSYEDSARPSRSYGGGSSMPSHEPRQPSPSTRVNRSDRADDDSIPSSPAQVARPRPPVSDGAGIPSQGRTRPNGKTYRQPGCKGTWNCTRCEGDGLSGTYYNLPFEDKERSWGSYKMFYDPDDRGRSNKPNGRPSDGAVNVEGSGICSSGKIAGTSCGTGRPTTCQPGQTLEYTGEICNNSCPNFFGEPTAKSGATGKCLVPFFSVAADLGENPPGTIIYVPEIKGQTVYLPPSGRPMKHPGYFMVADTGSAITGANRFDFFTGSYEQYDRLNVFGKSSLNKDLQMNLGTCDKTVRIIKKNNPDYAQAKAEMDDAIAAASAAGGQRTGLTQTTASAR